MNPSFLPPPPANLTGHLLLASPALRDSIFGKSVILVTEKSKTGYEGMIINKPTAKTLGEIIIKAKNTSLGDTQVYLSGPVRQDAINFLIINVCSQEGFRFRANVSLKEAIYRKEEEHTIVLPCLGFAAWAPKQLEHEFNECAWFHRDPPSYIAERKLVASDWKSLLTEISPYHRLIANVPSNIGDN
jgi:putative transcriptional regulator